MNVLCPRGGLVLNDRSFGLQARQPRDFEQASRGREGGPCPLSPNVVLLGTALSGKHS